MPKIRTLAVTLLLITATTASASSHFVRVKSDPASRVALAGASAAIDYGSFLWLELDSSQIRQLRNQGIEVTEVPDAGRVHVPGYQFDPLRAGEPNIPSSLRQSDSGPGFQLIQLVGPTRAAWVDELEQLGLPMLQYYPHHTYLTWATPSQAEAALIKPWLRWQGRFHPAYKINSDLRGRQGPIDNVDIMIYDDGNLRGTLDAIAAMGANIIQTYPAQPDRAFFDAIVVLDASRIEDVARLDAVLWLGYSSPEPELEDEMSDQIVAGNHTGGVPFTGYNAWLTTLGFDGSGVIWSTTDTGVDYDHPDFQGRIVGGYSYPGACNTNPGDDCSGGGHGTHVTGIIGGDAAAGFTDPSGFFYGLGMAPGYSIFAQNPLSGPSWPPTGGWQEMTKQAALGNAVGANNSWTTGEGTAHGYQASERTHDFAVRDANFDTTGVAEPLILVFSAGNSGSGSMTLTAPKEAKNLIVTASSRNYRVGSIEDISSFSSRGPAVDGRYVPTIAAPGEQIASARNDLGGSCSTPISGTNNYYAYCSGTSMAAPHVSGTVTVLTEWWRSFNSGADPSPAMAKALLINGAVDMGGPAAIPNFVEGWGRIDLSNVAASGADVDYRDQIDVFDNTGEQYVATLGVPNASEPVKVTLVWADAPGSVGANPALVNDLDLTVQDGASTYLGNVFSGGWSTTGGSADTINNAENVFIQNPGSSITITIDATNISGDGVPLSGDATDQDFALICYNCLAQPDFTIDVTPASQAVCAPADAVYTVDVGSVLGFTNPVTLVATGNPPGTTVNFSVNPVTPPGTSVMTVTNTGGGTPGSYTITVTGTSGALSHPRPVDLDLFDIIPAAPTLLTPPDLATGVSITPTYIWSAVAQAATYEIEVATDAGFTNIVDTAAGLTSATYSGSALTPLTTYFWRVRADNGCGTGPDSAIFSFTTAAIPYPTTNAPVCIDFETGAFPAYVMTETDTNGAANGRAIVSAGNPHSGTYAAQIDTDCDGCGGNTTQAIVVAVNLAGSTAVDLDFWVREFSDENNAEDGLFISDDLGASYDQILSFNGFPSSYQNVQLDLAAAAASVGRSLVDGFLIKFQSNDNFSIPTDGYAFDDICINNCPAISLTPSTLPNGQVGTAYSQTVTASGGTGPYTYAVSSGALPTGLSLNGSTGDITGTPTAAGTFNFDITATDANGCPGTQSYSVTVTCATITLSPTTLPNGAVGVAYSQTVTASGGAAPYTYAVTIGALPPGLSIDTNTGAITGTPTMGGVFTFAVTATDANGCTGSQSYDLTIDCPVITLSPTTLPNGQVGTAYNETVTASGGTAPYTYQVSSGALPTGLSLDINTGDITGTPNAFGTFNFDITATDASACTGTQSYTVVITDCPVITLTPTTLPNGQVGVAYSETVTASGGTAPYTYQVSSGVLPTGLSLDTNTGDITGTPTTIGTFNFDITATDATSCTGTQSYSVDITSCGGNITITPGSLNDGVEGIPYSVTFQASGGTAPYTWMATGTLPPGLTLNATTGELSGTPTAAGDYSFDIIATDASGCTGRYPIQLQAQLDSPTRASYAMTVWPAVDFLVGEGHGPANLNNVRVFDRTGQPAGIDFTAYLAGGFGANTSSGEIDGGPYWEILTGPGPGAQFGPQLKAFDRTGAPMGKVNFYAYGTLRYGVNPAAAQLDGDSFSEILSGAGPGSVFGPHVRGWNFDATQIGSMGKVNFYAYGTLKWGVNVEDGDIDGDSFAEILTGPGPGQVFGAQVRGWNFDGTQLSSMAKVNFSPFTTLFGVNLAGADVEADGFDEIAVAKGAGPTNDSDFAGYDFDASAITALPGFTVNPFGTLFGGRVAFGDITGDFNADLVAGAGPDPAADSTVNTYTYDGAALNLQTNAFLPFTSLYGVGVGAGATGYF